MKELCENCKRKNQAHEYQDSKFGKFIREKNKTKDGNLRCTVCSEVDKKK